MKRIVCSILLLIAAAQSPTIQCDQASLVDLVVFSYNRPMQLYALLESIEQYITGLGEATVIYRVGGPAYRRGYDELIARFPFVKFVQQGAVPKNDFKRLTLQATFNSPSDYIIFAVDDNVVKSQVDLTQCARALKNTGAYGFYLRLGRHINYSYMTTQDIKVPPLRDVGDGIFTWQFSQGTGEWKYPNTVDMTIYKKSDIEGLLRRLSFKNPNTFEGSWSQRAQMHKYGLCFADSKIIGLPLNLVNISTNNNMSLFSVQQLQQKFDSGLKIDIEPISTLEHRSSHVAYHPQFIAR